MSWVSVALIAISVFQAPRQPPAPLDVPTRVLVVTYSDERTTEHLLRPRGAYSTQLFPRKPDAPGYDGLSLEALQVEFRAAVDVRVRVSLSYGSPQQKNVPIAEAVIGAEPVRIAGLEVYGVDPIVISVEPFLPAPLVPPVAASASPLIDANVDLIKSDVPMYMFRLRNRSSRAVRSVEYLMFRGDKKIGSGLQKTHLHTPIIAAAGEYTWMAPVGAGTARGFDLFQVSGVLWEDGTVEGDPQLKASEDAMALGTAGQLRRVLALLNDAEPSGDAHGTPWSIAQLRDVVEHLPIDGLPSDRRLSQEIEKLVKLGRLVANTVVLRELSEFASTAQPNDSEAIKAWIAAARGRYSAWLRRTSVK